jgi:hypothetical protein
LYGLSLWHAGRTANQNANCRDFLVDFSSDKIRFRILKMGI